MFNESNSPMYTNSSPLPGMCLLGDSKKTCLGHCSLLKKKKKKKTIFLIKTITPGRKRGLWSRAAQTTPKMRQAHSDLEILCFSLRISICLTALKETSLLVGRVGSAGLGWQGEPEKEAQLLGILGIEDVWRRYMPQSKKRTCKPTIGYLACRSHLLIPKAEPNDTPDLRHSLGSPCLFATQMHDAGSDGWAGSDDQMQRQGNQRPKGGAREKLLKIYWANFNHIFFQKDLLSIG